MHRFKPIFVIPEYEGGTLIYAKLRAAYFTRDLPKNRQPFGEPPQLATLKAMQLFRSGVRHAPHELLQHNSLKLSRYSLTVFVVALHAQESRSVPG